MTPNTYLLVFLLILLNITQWPYLSAEAKNDIAGSSSSSSSSSRSSKPTIYEEITYGLTKLPPLPTTIRHYHKYNISHPHAGKFIPRNIFIAVRDVNDVAGHIWDMKSRNPRWHLNLCDNACKDEFMKIVYNGTGFYWAYHIINPEIGTAKAELWRLAVLYAYGGLYIDDDSTIKNDLDSTVLPTDKFIIAKEGYDMDDRCFNDSFPLSNKSMVERFGIDSIQRQFFGNKFFLNWIMYSAPKSWFVGRVMEYVVKLILQEFLFEPAIKMTKDTHRGMLLQCVSTYPLTYVAREVMLMNESNSAEIRVEEHWFERIGAVFKVFYPDYRGDHWVKQLKNNVPYLRWYLNPLVQKAKDGKAEKMLLQVRGDRTVYMILNGTKRAFQDLSTFISMGFDFSEVAAVTPDVFSQIPTGEPLPHHDRRLFENIIPRNRNSDTSTVNAINGVNEVNDKDASMSKYLLRGVI